MSDIIKCHKCHSDHDVLQFEEALANGNEEAICYKALVDRIEGSMNEWMVLGNQAFKRGDSVAHWEACQMVKQLEAQRDGLRKPILTPPTPAPDLKQEGEK